MLHRRRSSSIVPKRVRHKAGRTPIPAMGKGLAFSAAKEYFQRTSFDVRGE